MIAGAVKRRSGAPYEIPSGAPYNAPTYCPTPTYDNTGSCLHFSVVDMHNEIGRDWRGWRFWAAMTPYYQQDDRLENPSILTSHDGYHWVLPNGVANPIYPAPTDEALWNADTDLAYDPVHDHMVLTFQGEREGAAMQDQVFVRSPNGSAWPPRTSPGGLDPAYARNASASIFRDGDGSWLMFSVYTAGSGSSGVRQMMRWRSAHATGPWADRQECSGFTAPNADGLWHAEVMRDSDGVYRALAWGGWTSGYVFALSSSNGITWNRSASAVLKPSSAEPSLAELGRWDSSELYRGSFTDAGDRFRVWYSGTPGGKLTTTSWRIGYTEIPKSEWPAPPA